MESIQKVSRADQVRHFVLERLIEPGRAAGERTVTVRAGDVQRGLGWWNRVPSVCSALDGREFERMSHTRLIERRGPVQSTTAEWVFALSDDPDDAAVGVGMDPAAPSSPRRLVAVWDGESFQPCVAPENLEPGQRVVLMVATVQDPRDLAGKFGSFVGTLSDEEASEMQETLDRAFETISDEW
jgi:hypothetical protein